MDRLKDDFIASLPEQPRWLRCFYVLVFVRLLWLKHGWFGKPAPPRALRPTLICAKADQTQKPIMSPAAEKRAGLAAEPRYRQMSRWQVPAQKRKARRMAGLRLPAI
jgi:hypothetical protein